MSIMISVIKKFLERFMTILFNSWIYTKDIDKLSQYVPKPCHCYVINFKVELNMSNCATKADLEGTTGAETLDLAAKSDLASLKFKIDKIHKDKLKTVPFKQAKQCSN